MRAISNELKQSLANGTITLCVKLTDVFGDIKAFNGSDKTLDISGTTYLPFSTVVVSAMKQSIGTGVDNQDMTFAASTQLYTLDQFKSDILTSNEVEMFLVDFENLSYGICKLAKGSLSNLKLNSDELVSTIFKGLTYRTKATVGPALSPYCRCKRLGDNECKANLTTVTFARTVSVVTDAYNLTLSGDTHTTGYFNAGLITFTSGENDGLMREIKEHTNSGSTALLTLRDPFPFPVNVSDTVTVTKGCDRTPTACKGFVERVTGVNNIINFRGEPFLPGNKVLLDSPANK